MSTFLKRINPSPLRIALNLPERMKLPPHNVAIPLPNKFYDIVSENEAL